MITSKREIAEVLGGHIKPTHVTVLGAYRVERAEKIDKTYPKIVEHLLVREKWQVPDPKLHYITRAGLDTPIIEASAPVCAAAAAAEVKALWLELVTRI